MLKSAALTVPSALMAMGSGGNASSSTYAAVSDGTLTVRNQTQLKDRKCFVATATLAVIPKTTGSVRPDTPALKQTAQLIGEIGGQAIDIVRTQGAIKAEKAAEASGESKVNRPADDAPEKDWEDYKKALTETPSYKAAMKDYGTGGDFQRAAQAATAALTALAGGDIQKALAGASAPYLAQLVKAATMPQDGSKATASDIAANAMGHAVVGAVVAELSGQNVAGGAVGAAGGELAARSIMAYLYPGKETKDLTEAEKQSVSALATVASGLASGLVTGDTTGAASGAQAGRNATENNFLSATEADRKAVLERREKAGTLTADEAKELADTRKLDKDRDQAIHDICTQGNKSGGACSALVAQAQQALNTYGGNVSYNLIFKDLYPQDATNASAILKGLDEGSITRDAAITAIAKATGKGWDEVASQYDSVMTAHAITVALAGVYGMKSTVPDSKGITPALESGEYSAIKPGPLKPSMAETFSGGRYQEKTFTEDTILYRAGVSDTPFGQYFSFEKPTSVIQTRIDKAVLRKRP
ncbi:VENN motif pre-toxin domain-containing protein [Brenneria uluponensis]|uniref:VENN motif pre-toxin domain-containing protein n=1 Tax=Brenneria uluponensis TaxID=3057057 RepID=UPI0028EE4C8F|nr:VENN motif pre-toxin domain-containing protein [Brenneria ulupoensis]